MKTFLIHYFAKNNMQLYFIEVDFFSITHSSLGNFEVLFVPNIFVKCLKKCIFPCIYLVQMVDLLFVMSFGDIHISILYVFNILQLQISYDFFGCVVLNSCMHLCQLLSLMSHHWVLPHETFCAITYLFKLLSGFLFPPSLGQNSKPTMNSSAMLCMVSAD